MFHYRLWDGSSRLLCGYPEPFVGHSCGTEGDGVRTFRQQSGIQRNLGECMRKKTNIREPVSENTGGKPFLKNHRGHL
jgi:hypothetical protein